MRTAIIALLLALPLVQGCGALVAGGAAATGVVVSQDRRTVGTLTEDEGIEIKAASRIGDRFKDGVHINVTSYNRMVLLTGEVPDAAARTEAERIAWAVENVRGVHDELAVAGVSSYTVRSNDSLITTKVKAAILNEPSLKSAEINVETFKGVVQLSGFVSSQAAATKAVNVARGVSGVKSVKNDMRIK